MLSDLLKVKSQTIGNSDKPPIPKFQFQAKSESEVNGILRKLAGTNTNKPQLNYYWMILKTLMKLEILSPDMAKKTYLELELRK